MDDIKDFNNSNEIKEKNLSSPTVNQIKNIAQEEKSKPELSNKVKADSSLKINSLEHLIQICLDKKEIKLKYELEKNVNLVKFEQNRIEISFNDSLDKNFVKDLSTKLFEWTNERWIITFSKAKGEISIKDKIVQNKNDPKYVKMSDNFDSSIAFQTACDLVFKGKEQPSGYTEPLLHLNRLNKKSNLN